MSASPRRGFTGGKRAKDARGTLKRLIGYIAKGNKVQYPVFPPLFSSNR